MTNEPTTVNIAKALRVCFEKTCACSECPFEHEYCGDIEQLAADRLESQEAQIKQLAEALAYANEWHKDSVENATNELRELSGIAGELEAMTARAEQAERERDAAVAVIGIQAKQLKESHVVLCNICKFEDMIGCVHKNHCDGYQLFKWRGLQQDGEGV